jgi:deoxyhypusine monooxygenase
MDPVPEVSETCGLALSRIAHARVVATAPKPSCKDSQFLSIDPAYPFEKKSLELLESFLLNEDLELCHRYRAMFALRDMNTSESVKALCRGKL